VKTLSLSITGLALFATGASAQIDFDPAQSIPTGQNPDGAAIGDFDGDGDVDLAATADGPDRVVIFSQAGGVFSQTGSVLVGASTSPHRLIAADLDGDGDVDLAVSLQDAGQVRLIVNDGAGNFSAGASLAAGLEPRDLVVGDVDGDGDADLAVSNRDGNSVTFFRNNGAGGFTGQTIATGQDPRELAIGDFDGDGDLDLATSASDSRRVDVLTNQGASFALTQSIQFFSPFRPEGLTAADVDGDGDVDLVGTSSDDVILAQDVASVMINTGGTFASPIHYATNGFDSSSIEAADLDGDGDQDLLIANESSNTVSALANSGAGTFGGPSIFAVGLNPGDVVLGDVNGDGAIDAMIPNDDGNDVSFLANANAGGVDASIDPRNGSGVNPDVFTTITLPITGTSWDSQVDAGAAGAVGGITVLAAYPSPLTGVNTAYGELLVDVTGGLLGGSVALVTGGLSTHSNPIPSNPAILGDTFSAQTWIGEIGQLTNALDGVIGNQ